MGEADLALQIRQLYVPTPCLLHFKRKPLKISNAYGQYLYGADGVTYLDCVNNQSHVGHCHPHIVKVASTQLSTFQTTEDNVSTTPNVSVQQYIHKLQERFPPELCAFYFTNSGSEAIDLAMVLAQSHTKHSDFLVVDGAFHGAHGLAASCSPRQWRNSELNNDHWAHAIPLPDLYRGVHRDTDPEAEIKYIVESNNIIQKAVMKGGKIAGFITEPIATIQGIIVPPASWLVSVTKAVRQLGGLLIVDEVNTGFGRCGDHFWGYEMHGIVPDIVILGKPIGNGYPMGVVVTKKQIAQSFPSTHNLSHYSGNPAACTIGITVFNVLESEKLIESGSHIGRLLMQGLQTLETTYETVGNVRGKGMMIGIEMVTDKASRKPNSSYTEQVAFLLKEEEHVIVGVGGNHKNVLLLLPPLCFTSENVVQLLEALNRTLSRSMVSNGTGNVALFPFTESLDSLGSPPNSPGDSHNRYSDMD